MDSTLKNLAGNKRCGVTIKSELTKAGIGIVELDAPMQSEVPASVKGQLTKNHVVKFTFERAWYYWMVTGNVPLDVANEMYANPVGKKDVRVAGHCGCPPPEEWAFPNGEDVVRYLKENGLKSVTYGELAELCNSGKIKGNRFVGNYHIDSQKGLNLFVATLKKHGLVD